MSPGMPQLLDENATHELERQMFGSTPTATIHGQIVSISPDPLRPGDVQIPAFMQSMPPTCPSCLLLLEGTNVNPVGDILFVCMNDGYEAVWRRETNSWDQRAGVRQSDWKAPGTVTLSKGDTREKVQKRRIEAIVKKGKVDVPRVQDHPAWKDPGTGKTKPKGRRKR